MTKQTASFPPQVADVKRVPPKRPWGDLPRPPPSLCPDFFSALAARCCDNDPDRRPNFQEARSFVAARVFFSCAGVSSKHHDPFSAIKKPVIHRQILSSLRALDIPGLLDTMLEKAAGHARSADLLHNVFPPRVAKALAEGRTVEPEHYDSVTIFFRWPIS